MDFACGTNRLLKKYEIDGKLKWLDLLQAFVGCKDKHDQVKLGVAYLVEGFLFSEATSILVRPEFLA